MLMTQTGPSSVSIIPSGRRFTSEREMHLGRPGILWGKRLRRHPGMQQGGRIDNATDHELDRGVYCSFAHPQYSN